MSGRTVLLALVALLLGAALAVSRYFPEYLPWRRPGLRSTAAPEAALSSGSRPRRRSGWRASTRDCGFRPTGARSRPWARSAASCADGAAGRGRGRLRLGKLEDRLRRRRARHSLDLPALQRALHDHARRQAAKERGPVRAVQLAPDVAIRPELHTTA